jgi:glycosyltransferase involved in cell wall biosynthesis
MLFRLAPRPTGAIPLAGRAPQHRVDRPLRIAILLYRGNPRCGGQGVYTRYISRALTRLGHTVEVFSGPPYPQLDPGVRLTRVPSLDLYRTDDPFRVPRLWEFRDGIDVAEFALMCTAGFPEPLTYSLRVVRELRPRLAEFDVIHDNQCLGYGLLQLLRETVPVVATIHHPITVDRRLDLAAATGVKRRVSLLRWYGFTRMQRRVARRMPRVLTVSESSRRDLVAELDIDDSRLHIVPLGVDEERFRPLPETARVRGRILTTASADVPLKGLVHLIDALPEIRRRHPDAHLVVVGRAKENGAVEAAIRRLSLGDSVRFEHGISDERLNELYAQAEVAVVPSLYEGFSLPAVESMAAGCALVASDAGALPEVVGRDATAALLATPGQPASLSAAIDAILGDPELRDRLGGGGRERALRMFSWSACAAATVEHYRDAMAAAAAC